MAIGLISGSEPQESHGIDNVFLHQSLLSVGEKYNTGVEKAAGQGGHVTSITCDTFLIFVWFDNSFCSQVSH